MINMLLQEIVCLPLLKNGYQIPFFIVKMAGIYLLTTSIIEGAGLRWIVFVY